MNDPVADRLFRIEGAMRYTNLSREEATAQVDAEIAQEEAEAGAIVYLLDRLRELRVAAA